jgi:type IV pilus assembly protein PilN
MIRINLLGEQATQAVSGKSIITNLTQTLMAPSQAGGGAGDILLKIIVAIGPIIACIGTEQWIVGNKQQELSKIANELASKQAEIESKKKDVEQVQRFKADKAQLDLRMNTIRTLSKARLKNVKVLDAIQNIIPTRAWLSSLKLEENKVDVKGKAMEDNDISAFMKGLEENIYFGNVNLINSSSVKTEDGTLKDFDIAASLENL